ncbi:MAG: dimethylarginine dimethylaminohydrolase family protein, partial [Gemmatimonadota bacterium]
LHAASRRFTPLHAASRRFTPLHAASCRFLPLPSASFRFLPLPAASRRSCCSFLFIRMTIALTRGVPADVTRCELTHIERSPIDPSVARSQHAAYEAALVEAGLTVRQLATLEELPDSVFVEDVAVVLEEVAVLARPGAKSRRPEVEAIEPALAEHRPLARIVAPGVLDGGDVLALDRRILVGIGTRTNAEGAAQLGAILRPFGYRVDAVAIGPALHLKTALTRVGPELLLANRHWSGDFDAGGYGIIDVADVEPFGANALWTGSHVIYASAFPATAKRLAAAGASLIIVDASELAKAEGGVTCCSLLV